MSDSLAILAASWGVVMGVSPLLQVERIIARRSSADLSITYYVVVLIGTVLWLAYGLSLGNPALILPNVVSLGIGLVVIAVARRYRGGGADTVQKDVTMAGDPLPAAG